MHLLNSTTINDELISDIIARDCVLWLTNDVIDSKTLLDDCIALVNEPWRAVYIESASGEFASALEKKGLDFDSKDLTGAFSHLIASDPVSLILQRRAKPIFFLNGRSDRSDSEGAGLPKRSTDRRRLNMTARLRDIEPRRIIVVGKKSSSAIEDLVDLWSSEFRALLTIVTDEENKKNEVTSLLEQAVNLNVVQWVSQSISEFSTAITNRIAQLAPDSSLVVTVKLAGNHLLEVDLATAEMIEQPITDVCDFICVKDTLPVSPDDLQYEEFQKFFTKNNLSWRPYSAGLYWSRDKSVEKKFLKKLDDQLIDPSENIQIFSIVSEPGAGGTTQAQALAYAAAKAGFPVLIAKQHCEPPNPLEFTSFLFRALSLISRKAMAKGYEPIENIGEPVWLLVLDIQHSGQSFEDLEHLCIDINRSGRKVAILKIVPIDLPLDAPKSIPHTELVTVSHNLEYEEAKNLGQHLNSFLRNFGKDKSPEEWTRFWQDHCPDIDIGGIASFWIALEFWLAGFLELGESIQGWVLRQFRNVSEKEIQTALMEIAALSIERKGTPERLLMPLKTLNFPWSYVLENARHDAPGLGLVQANSVPYGRVWAIAHDVLARYLLNGIWNDRPLCESLSVPVCDDAIQLRLKMIERISKRSNITESFARPFAISLAMNMLKLDEQHGNAEFFKYWREVIDILESVPRTIRLSSRTFNHHLAISLRRVTQDNLFEIDDIEKKYLLTKAARNVEFALDNIDATPDDESNLNLLNTLALIYQDLFELERGLNGDPIELSRLLAKSDEITNRALKENPNSPYVLETAAKNLLRQSSIISESTEKAESTAKALAFIFQASRLETAFNREMKLGKLATQALCQLRDSSVENAINQLCAQGNPYGFIAKAWGSIPVANNEALSLFDAVNAEHAANAIKILEQTPKDSRNWLLVSFLYDLTVIAEEKNFTSQLSLLDELSSVRGYQLSLQQILERAVLLFLNGRYKPADEEFRKLRPRVKESQTIIFVPPRLKWLLTPDRHNRATCTASVIDSAASVRGMAKVKELGGVFATFHPQEFGKTRMAPNEQFKCQVTFSAMGPFLKPIDSTHR